jgi:tetratricopeptide (TPR) repeat protein
MDNATRNRGKRATAASLVEAFSKHQAMLLVVEDVHWADRPTLEHLATLTETVAGCPTLLVMTSRIEGDPLDLAWRSSTAARPLMTIDLGPLRPQEATALAGAYLDATADFAQRCVERAAGNPLFLEQLLRHAEQSSAASVPGSVQSLVQARIDQLDARDKQALQAASVFGQRFALEALRHLTDVPDYSCATLVRRFLIRPVGDDFLFAHALIRDAVYDSLLRARRRELHLHAAAWFADRDLVLHAEHLDRAEDPTAPEAYLAAARAEAAGYHYERALALTDRGLAIAIDPARRFALTCFQGEITHDLGAMAESRAAYERALESAANECERVPAWIGLAAVKRVTEDLDGASADLDLAQAAAERHGLLEEQGRIHFLRGNLYFPRGNIEGCLSEHQKSLELGRAAGSAELEANALGGLGDAEYVRGRMLTARGYFERCIEVCRKHGFGRIEVASLPMAAFTRFYAGELPGAYADALAAMAAAERVGHHRAAIITCHIVCLAAVSQAELAVASRHVERAIDLSRQLGAQRFEAEGHWFQAEIMHAEGRRTEALVSIRHALEISRETGMTFLGPAILGGLPQINLAPDERRAALAEGERLLATGSISHNHLFFYQRAIETALAQDDWSEAERYAQALADHTRREHLPYIDVVVARAQALAALGRGRRDSETLETLRQVRDRAEAIGWRSMIPNLDAALASLSRTPNA